MVVEEDHVLDSIDGVLHLVLHDVIHAVYQEAQVADASVDLMQERI